ncbi:MULTISPECIES: DHA2 family efflux MFS transporter permease subunit [Priestia]|uniref:DHA2 family efflux MFS transporter permease subunit n=1 Tax=Priestia TaxID=2800373 RepID=UPI0030013A61
MNKQITDPSYNRPLLMIILLTGVFLALLNQTIVITALPQIIGDFGIEASKAQWLITSFMLVNAIIVPISTFFIAKFSTRQLFFAAISVFLIGTALGGVSITFSMLLAARFIQAVGAGIMMPLVSNIILLITPPEKRGSAMGLMVLVICFSPAIAPTLAGSIVDVLSWRYLFYGTIPLTIAVFIMALFTLKNVTETNQNEKLNFVSIFLSTLTFGSIVYSLSLAGELGWTNGTTLIWGLVGIIALILLIVKQLNLAHPMLEFRVFKYKMFTYCCLLLTVAFGTMLGIETLIPIYTQEVEGVSAFESGLILLPGAALMGGISPFVGRVVDKIGARHLVVLGFIIIAISTIPLAIMTIPLSIDLLVILYTLRMVGVGLVMTPLQTAAMNAIPQHLISHGVAVYSTVNSIAGSIGISLIVSVYTNISNKSTVITGLFPEKYAIGITFIVITIVSGLAAILAFKLTQENRKSVLQSETVSGK